MNVYLLKESVAACSLNMREMSIIVILFQEEDVMPSEIYRQLAANQ